MRHQPLSRILACTAFALVLSALGASALDDGFAIKRNLKEGTSKKYSMVVEFEVGGGLGHLEATVTEKVASVDKDGNYTISQSQENASGTFGGEKVDVPARPPINLTYKPNGQVTSIKDASDAATKSQLVDSMSYRMENLATILDPGKNIEVGDLWNGVFKEDKSVGTVDAKAEYKLLAEEKIGDIDTLKIKGTVRESEGDKPAINEFTEWRSKADGSLVQLEEKWTNAPFPGVSYPVSASIKMYLLPNK